MQPLKMGKHIHQSLKLMKYHLVPAHCLRRVTYKMKLILTQVYFLYFIIFSCGTFYATCYLNLFYITIIYVGHVN